MDACQFAHMVVTLFTEVLPVTRQTVCKLQEAVCFSLRRKSQREELSRCTEQGQRQSMPKDTPVHGWRAAVLRFSAPPGRPKTGDGRRVNPLKSQSYRAGLEVTWKRVILCPEFRDFQHFSTILFSCIIQQQFQATEYIP